MTEFRVDGRIVSGYIALPESGKGPGVLVLHAWWGLNDFFKQVCERLAQVGFVAFAPDLYRGKIATTIEEAQQLQTTLDSDEAVQDIVTAITYLRTQASPIGEKIGVVGFSMGGNFALEMSTDDPAIVAVVTFYGTEQGSDYTTAKAAFLGHFGEQDEWEPAESVAAMEQVLRAANKDSTFYRYPGAQHWFFEENRSDVYDAEAAQLAWDRTVAFLHRQLT